MYARRRAFCPGEVMIRAARESPYLTSSITGIERLGMIRLIFSERHPNVYLVRRFSLALCCVDHVLISGGGVRSEFSDVNARGRSSYAFLSDIKAWIARQGWQNVRDRAACRSMEAKPYRP